MNPSEDEKTQPKSNGSYLHLNLDTRERRVLRWFSVYLEVLERRVPAFHGRDELGMLAESFNFMTDKLVNSQKGLQEANKNLEKQSLQLKRSVAELRRSNATIHSDRLPVITGNRTLLIQLFQNLVENSLK